MYNINMRMDIISHTHNKEEYHVRSCEYFICFFSV